MWGFKYLTSTWIHAFEGGNADATLRKLRRLYDAGYLDRPQQQRYSQNANYKHIVYERTEKAALEAKALLPTRRQSAHRSNSYPHELIVDLGFYAPMHLASKLDGTLHVHMAKRLMDGDCFMIETKHGPRRLGFPESTRESDDPFNVPMGGDRAIRFDGTPFLLERNGSFIFVPGIEVDRRTEGLTTRAPKDPTRTTLARHLDDIMEFFESKKHRSYYGFSMMMVPIITTNESHTESAMAYVEKKLGKCQYMLFDTLPDLALEPHFPKPSADLFLRPKRRVGYKEFCFDESGFR